MGSVIFSSIWESKALAYATYTNVIVPSKSNDEFAIITYMGCRADKTKETINNIRE